MGAKVERVLTTHASDGYSLLNITVSLESANLNCLVPVKVFAEMIVRASEEAARKDREETVQYITGGKGGYCIMEKLVPL